MSRGPSPVGRILLAALAAAGVVGPAAPAWGVVSLSPTTAPTRSFGTYTLTVPNEPTDQSTVAVDVRLPAGFVLEDAHAVPGWKTVVDTGADGTAVAVHWRGGRIPPRTFGVFAMRGRTPDRAGVLAFAVEQRFERSRESWIGPPGTEKPAPTLLVEAGGADPPRVPAAPAPTDTSAAARVDPLARSRAALGLSLAATALLVALGALGTVLRRGRTGAATEGPAEPARAAPGLSPSLRSAGQRQRGRKP